MLVMPITCELFQTLDLASPCWPNRISQPARTVGSHLGQKTDWRRLGGSTPGGLAQSVEIRHARKRIKHTVRKFGLSTYPCKPTCFSTPCNKPAHKHSWRHQLRPFCVTHVENWQRIAAKCCQVTIFHLPLSNLCIQ